MNKNLILMFIFIALILIFDLIFIIDYYYPNLPIKPTVPPYLKDFVTYIPIHK